MCLFLSAPSSWLAKSIPVSVQHYAQQRWNYCRWLRFWGCFYLSAMLWAVNDSSCHRSQSTSARWQWLCPFHLGWIQTSDLQLKSNAGCSQLLSYADFLYCKEWVYRLLFKIPHLCSLTFLLHALGQNSQAICALSYITRLKISLEISARVAVL